MKKIAEYVARIIMLCRMININVVEKCLLLSIQLQNETILESQLAQKQGGPMISCIPDDDDFPSRGDTDCGTYTDKGCRGFALTSTLRVRARLPSFARV